MNGYVIILILFLVVYMTITNVKSYKALKKNKEYIECFNKVKIKDENAYEYVSNYLQKETDQELRTKALILKYFLELNKEDDSYKTTLQEIDVKNLLYANDKLITEGVITNADSFVIMILCMVKARNVGYRDGMNLLYDKIIAYEKECEDTVEYQLCVNVYKAIKEINDNGVAFFNCLLNGEYTTYRYEKRFVGSYKRIAAATLAYLNEPLSEYDSEDIKVFATSFIGEIYLKELGIIDKYKEEI